MRPATEIPAGITFNAQYRAIASSYGLGDLEAESEFEVFVDYHRSLESERAHWPTTWRAWLKEAGKIEASRRRRPALLPSDYVLADDHRKIAIEVVTKALGERPSEERIRAQFERFCAYNRRKGNLSANWVVAWRQWCVNAVKFAKRDALLAKWPRSASTR